MNVKIYFLDIPQKLELYKYDRFLLHQIESQKLFQPSDVTTMLSFFISYYIKKTYGEKKNIE